MDIIIFGEKRMPKYSLPATLVGIVLCSTPSLAQNAYIPDYSAVNVSDGSNPAFLAADLPAGEPYSNVYVVDTGTNKVVTTIPVPVYPYGVAVSQDGRTAWVVTQSPSFSVQSNELIKIDTKTNAIVGLFAANHLPYGVAVTPDNKKIYITYAGADSNGNLANTVQIANISSGYSSKNMTICCQPFGVATTPDGSKAYVGGFGSNDLSVLDTKTDAVITKIALPNTPFMIAVSPDSSRVYVASQNGNAVYVIDTTTEKVIKTISTPAPLTVAVSGDGSRIFAGNTNLNQKNTVSVFDAKGYAIKSTFLVDYPFGFGVVPNGKELITVNNNGKNAIVTDSKTNAVLATVTVGANPFIFGVPVQPPSTPKFAGTPGTQNCYQTSVSALDHKYHNLHDAAKTLGYSSLSAIQHDIREYCSA